ncbi:MAG TPA: exonuclease SbcCD subunit D [Nocardioidaceae bacterium]|nr:exonuclease SbcCD subunit D [Nocardioidaceae bacterium]
MLHTSDWHLGRRFHQVGLLDAQAQFVDHLLAVVESENVDLVVVSGDVYDRALPAVDAVEVADEAFARLASSRASVVVTSGNHDSPVRLGFNARLADAAGVHFRTRWQDVGAPVLLEDGHGPVAVYGLPYLEPDAVRRAWQLPARTHESALTAAMARVHADLDTRSGTRAVVMAHAFVAGDPDGDLAPDRLASDSERDISVGGLQIVPAALFGGVDYTALGHLHGRARLAETVRYSGSPLAYSFSEARHTKGSWLVELGASGVEQVEFVPAPVPRSLGTLRGRLEELLRDPGHGDLEDHWLQVTLTDRRRPQHAMDRLRDRFPHALVLRFQPDGASAVRRAPLPHVQASSDHDVALGFVAEVRELEATTEEALLLQMACESCRTAQDGRDDRLTGLRVEAG